MFLVVLASFSGGNGRIRGGMGRLQKATECGRISFVRMLDELEADGWIRRHDGLLFLQLDRMMACQAPEPNRRIGESAVDRHGRFLTTTGAVGAPNQRKDHPRDRTYWS
jgi:hypothetical protein